MEIEPLNIIRSQKICAFLITEHSNVCTQQLKQKEWLWECASLCLGQTKLGVKTTWLKANHSEHTDWVRKEHWDRKYNYDIVIKHYTL